MQSGASGAWGRANAQFTLAWLPFEATMHFNATNGDASTFAGRKLVVVGSSQLEHPDLEAEPAERD